MSKNDQRVLWESDGYRIIPGKWDYCWAGARMVHELRLEQRSSGDNWGLVAYTEYLSWPYFNFHSLKTATAYLQGYARCYAAR